MNNPHLEHQGLDGGRFLEHRGGQPALPGQIHPPEGGGRITGDVGPEVFPRQLLAALLLVDGDGCQDLALNLVAKAKLLYTGADSLSCLRRVCPGGQRLSQLRSQHILPLRVVREEGHVLHQLQYVKSVRQAQHLPLGNGDAPVVH